MNKGIEVITIDTAIERIAVKIKEIDGIIDSISIIDAKYSTDFFRKTRNALITLAVIKAFGIGEKAESYLVDIK